MAIAFPAQAVPTARVSSKVKYRVPAIWALALLFVAVTADALQFFFSFFHALNFILPGVGSAIAVVLTWFVGIFAEIIFFVWFLFPGVWATPKGKGMAMRFLIVISMVIAEFVPLINALPAITLGVLSLIIVSRAEDKLEKRAKDMKVAEFAQVARSQVFLAQQARNDYEQRRRQIIAVAGNTPDTRAADAYKKRRMERATQNLSTETPDKDATLGDAANIKEYR